MESYPPIRLAKSIWQTRNERWRKEDDLAIFVICSQLSEMLAHVIVLPEQIYENLDFDLRITCTLRKKKK